MKYLFLLALFCLPSCTSTISIKDGCNIPEDTAVKEDVGVTGAPA